MNIIIRIPKPTKKHKKCRKLSASIDMSHCVKSLILTEIPNYPIADTSEFPGYAEWSVQLTRVKSEDTENVEYQERQENLLSFIRSLEIAIETLKPGLFMAVDTHQYLSDTVDGLMSEVAAVIERVRGLLNDKFVRGAP